MTRVAQAIVSLEDVTVMYGAQAALSHVTVAFPPGATGLLGNNGAGKSTLIQAVLGLVETTSGRIDVLGRDVGRDARGVIGYVPERDAIVPELSAVGAVAYCGELAGIPRADAMARAHDVLAYVGLYDARYRAAETLSVGMRQRLKLAQAIIHDPEILLLDEPTNGLDPPGRERMLDLIQHLAQAAGMSVIVSSHLLPDIERTCDRCVILDHGRVVANAPVGAWNRDEVFPYEVRVKGDESAFCRALDAEGIGWRASDADFLLVTAPAADLPRIFASARRAGSQIRHLRRQTESLADFFDKVTTRR